MSHGLGVKCQECGEVLVEAGGCPEKGCDGNHGYGYQQPCAWATEHWPDHPCFQETT